ncbi:MAG: uroporphyrinogen decarboxylase family protein [Thermodesulfobacteriota bacterium]
MSNKALIQNLFSIKELVRLPFIPIVYRFGAKLIQISPEEMMGDATLLTNGLLTCQELFGYDAVVGGFDLAMHHDAMGYPISSGGGIPAIEISQMENIGPNPIVVEVIRRLTLMVGKRIGILGAMTGPITLAYTLGGKIVLEDPFTESSKRFLEASKEACLKISKAYGEFQVDGIIFFEGVLSSPAIRSIEGYSPVYQTLSNVIHFYNSRLIIALPHFYVNQLKSFYQLKPDALLLGEWKEGNLDFYEVKELLDRYQICIGIGIPFSSGREEMFRRLEWVVKGMENENLKRGIFLSSVGEVPYEMEAKELHDFMEAIGQIYL